MRFDGKESAQNQAEAINARLAQPYACTSTAITRFYEPQHGKPYKEGLAVLSRLPIVRSEALALTKRANDKHQRIIQNVDLEGETILKVSNIHLSNNQYSVAQLQEVLLICARRHEKRIIAGDFNVYSLADNRRLYEEEYTVSTDYKSYVSYPSEGQTLDYVLMPKGARFESLDVKQGLSDHAAVVFQVIL